MKIYKDTDLKEMYKTLEIDPEWKERDFVEYARNYMLKSNAKVLAISGLRGTGKTVGLLQAIKELDACYIIAGTEEEQTGEDYITALKKLDKQFIVIDEYTWIKERDKLDRYLYDCVLGGKRIAITGTESITLDYLNCGNLIHRMDIIHCTLFSYDEYCRLYNCQKSKETCELYLKQGGTFSAYIADNYDSMRDYIKNAIIDNLAAYTKMSTDKATAIVYSILYKAVCPSNLTAVPTLTDNHLTVNNFLDEMGINTDISFTSAELSRASDILERVGVVVTVPNWEEINSISKRRTYIVNPSMTYQLIKAAYDIQEVNHYLLGEVFEASAMAHLKYNKLSDDNIYYLESNSADVKNKELDIVITQQNGKSVYLFECKLRQDSKLSHKATLLSSEIEDLFPNGDIDGRYVIYTGKEVVRKFDGKTVIFSPLTSTIEHYYEFDRHITSLPFTKNQVSPPFG